MLLSILIPSRKRPERLLKTLRSIYDTVDNLNRIEVVIRMDNDDRGSFSELTSALVNDGPESPLFKIWEITQWLTGERMRGYDSLNLMYTECAEVALGKYIMICNDDFWFETKGWDSALADLDANVIKDNTAIIHFNTKDYGCYEGGPFPIVKNQIWKDAYVHGNIGLPAIPQPADTMLHEVVINILHGTTYYLKDHFWTHDRDRDEVLAEHRKL